MHSTVTAGDSNGKPGGMEDDLDLPYCCVSNCDTEGIMKIDQLKLLEKLLGMTTSANDNEALVAMRKANQLLKDNRITWGEILRKQVTVAVSQFTDDGPAAAPTDIVAATNAKVQDALDFLRGRDLGKSNDFIASLDKQWAEKKYLKPEQRKPLFEMYERHNGN
jgi:hypothetical protein